MLSHLPVTALIPSLLMKIAIYISIKIELTVPYRDKKRKKIPVQECIPLAQGNRHHPDQVLNCPDHIQLLSLSALLQTCNPLRNTWKSLDPMCFVCSQSCQPGIHDNVVFISQNLIAIILLNPLQHTLTVTCNLRERILLKTWWEKEKMLVTSIFSFSHNVFVLSLTHLIIWLT